MSLHFHIFWIAILYLYFSQINGNPLESLSSKDRDVDEKKVVRYFRSKTTSVLQCGEVLSNPTGAIFYKVVEPISENERCAWTVAAPNAYGYQINIQHLGFPPDEKLLSFAGFRRTRDSSDVAHSFPNSTGEILLSNINILIITFHSGSLNGSTNTGFFLQYQSLQMPGDPGVNPASRHEMVGPEITYLRHPTSGNYNNMELTTFVFPPANNTYGEHNKRNIFYERIGLEICRDFISIYIFNPSQNQWIFMGSICGDTDRELISGNDIILLVFQTDLSSTQGGFEMSLFNC